MHMRAFRLPAAGLLVLVVLLSCQVAAQSQATPKAPPTVPQAATAPKAVVPAPKSEAVQVAAAAESASPEGQTAPAAPTKLPAKEPVCGAEPAPLAEISPSITSCWADAALPVAAMNYSPMKIQGQQHSKLAATSWDELQHLIASADGPIHITITGSLTANSPLLIINKAKGVHIAGPAEIACTADSGTAISVQRSSGVVLEDLTISGCSDSAIIINATSAAKVAVPITTAVPGKSRTTPAPDALLNRVTIKDNTGIKGAGVRALRSRVVLQACSLSSNSADGCGGAVYADRSALLLLDTTIAQNVGNNTEGSDDCKGGALHTQDSWLAAARSTFTRNRGVNGSAVLLVRPVGVAQLQDCSFDSNQERPGVAEDFTSSSGSVAVIGTGAYEVYLERGTDTKCEPVTEGLAVARCTFKNNTAARSAGRGGSIAGNGAFIAVINTTFTGTPGNFTKHSAGTAASKSRAARIKQATNVGVKQLRSSPPTNSFLGGCIATEGSNLFVTGSSFSYCNSLYLGGAISARGVESLVQDSVFDHCHSGTGGAIRIMNGGHKFINLTITKCKAGDGGAGINLESNYFLDIHMQGLNLQHNVMTGKGAGIRAEVLANTEPGYTFTLSLHDSTITNNIAGEGAGLYIGGTTIAYLKNNTIAHNTALYHGGGMKVFNEPGSKYTFATVGNTFLNNSAVISGGGLITHPCNISMHGDKFLANRAGQNGGGLMVYGGDKVVLHNAQVSCNSAQNGAGIGVKQSDFGVDSALVVRCSNVTANGGAADMAAQERCLQVLGTRNNANLLPGTETFLAASAAGSAPAVVGTTSTTTGTEKGGGLYVASGQEATLISSRVSANRASRSGAGVFVDRGAYLEVGGDADAGPAVISYNNCTTGSGGGMYLNQETELQADDTIISNNQAMFGGGVFAMGDTTMLTGEAVTISNNRGMYGGGVLAMDGASMALDAAKFDSNTARTGGAVATLRGSDFNCTGCSFTNNKAEVGGALMLHGGSSHLTGSIMTTNIAAAAISEAATAILPERIPYVAGYVSTSAGGAVHVVQGKLNLSKCKLIGNVAWGPTGRGGAVFVDDAALQLVNTSITNNWASVAGGGVLLGSTGSAALQVTGGSFTGNAAQHYGGAVAAGMLLPADIAAVGERQWNLTFDTTRFTDNTAGRQGGAVACSICDSLSVASSTFQNNVAGQTGGGISCVGCKQYLTDGCTFAYNMASSGGGACIVAAGKGSSFSNSDFLGNLAVSKAATDATARLQGSYAAAEAVAASAVADRSANRPAPSGQVGELPSPRDVLPACGVASTGGGLCLGLWDADFSLAGSGSFVNNTGLFGAGLFIEACPEGPKQCPVRLDPKATVFRNNTMPAGHVDSYMRHLLQEQRAAAAAVGAITAGSGVDVYVTNATVLMPMAEGAAAAAARAHAVGRVPATRQAVPAVVKVRDTAAPAAAAGRRRSLQQHGHDSLAFASQLAAVAQQTTTHVSTGTAANSIATKIATGPAKLGGLMVAGRNTTKGSVLGSGRLQTVQLSVLDQVDGVVADAVAQQLLVQAKANFSRSCLTCELAGVSMVLPVNGTASFDQLEIKSTPGSNQIITFTLLSPVDGSELGGQQAISVSLPTCEWGQATMEAGCYNCLYPMFTFSRDALECSICPPNTDECNATTLLPGTGYWNSNPLSTHMHKCPRRDACRRASDVVDTLRCLQQQQLIINNPEHTDVGLQAGTMFGSSLQPDSPWKALRAKCIPILQHLASKTGNYTAPAAIGGSRDLLQLASQDSLMLNPFINNTEAVSAHYSTLLCTPGYAGKLCSKCEFPGNAYGPFGRTGSGACSRCPAWGVSVASYVMSRVFDMVLVGLLIITTLVEMKKRRKAVHAARQTQMLNLTVVQAANTGTQLAACSQDGGDADVVTEGISSKSLQATAANGGASSNAIAASNQTTQSDEWTRAPLFALELSQHRGAAASATTAATSRGLAGYTPSTLTVGELFEVLIDFLQVMSILQLALLSWQTVAASYFAALSGVSITPLSTKAWISLDCLMPRTLAVAQHLQLYQLAAQLLLPLACIVLMMAIFLTYALYFSRGNSMRLFRDVISRRLRAPIISTLLVVLSFFYPALAYAVLGTFSCRYLDPEGTSHTITGEVLSAPGWYWTMDLDMQCFVNPRHKALAYGVGIPGTILLLAYPILQCIVLGRCAAAGGLQPTSNFFADYGHLVEPFRPRLAPYWGALVQLRKLVLVAVMLVLASAGVVSQLLGGSLVLLAFWAATMGLLPYPYKLLNKLHLGTNGVLLVVVWINLFVEAMEDRDGGSLGSSSVEQSSLGLQLLSVVLVLVMVFVLLVLLVFKLYREAIKVLDVDQDGKVSVADIRASIANLRSKLGAIAAASVCMGGHSTATTAQKAAAATRPSGTPNS